MTHSEFFAALKAGQVKGPLVFIGEEQYVKQRAQEQLIAAFMSDALGDLNIEILEEPDADRVIAAAETLPFMAEKRLVIARDMPILKAGGRAVKEEAVQGEKLSKWLPGPDSAVVVFYQRGAMDGRKKVCQQLTKKAETVRFDPLGPVELQRWIQTELKRRGRRIAPDAAQRLPQLSGGRLSDLVRELDKLCAYNSEGDITLADVEAVATRSPEFQVFNMIDDAVAGKTQLVLAAYRNLLENGESPVGILVLLARNLRSILAVQRLMASGLRAGEAAKKAGVHPGNAAKAERYPMNVIQRGLSCCDLAGSWYRSGRIADTEVVENLLISIATRDFTLFESER